LSIAATARFDYFDHDADIGIVGYGSTVEAAFESAALATFSIMGDVGLVETSQHLAVEFVEDDVEIALVRLLNELLAQARLRRILLGEFRVAREGPIWRCLAHGGPWPATADPGVEVKGATMTGLSVASNDGEWTARCVVDV
jgi:SHS2 domain-containing protein